jgi:hypothetical protein
MAAAKTPRRVTVEVTEQDIAKAHINDSYKCVVSQAIARTVPTATNIETDTQTVRFTVDGERRVYLCPYAVAGYVIAFDAGDPIEPFSFQLREPRIKKRKLNTESGKIATRAATRARRAAVKAPVSEDSPTQSDDPAKAAKAAYAQARAEHPGPVRKTVGEEGTNFSPPRVWKKKRRSYGHRLLRINRLPGDTAESKIL